MRVRLPFLLVLLVLALPAGCGTGLPSFEVLPNVAPSGDWLARVNQFRAWAGLDPLTVDAALTPGGDLHCKWMVVNNTIAHGEIPGTECYSLAGHQAGMNSNLVVQSPTPNTVESALRGWMTGPFHGIALIDPRLTRTSFSQYVDNNRIGSFTYGAALDVASHRDGSLPPVPVLWPGDGATVDLLSYDGSETPDPVVPYGLVPPTGLPIYLQLPFGVPYPPDITDSRFSRGATPLAHLVYDGGTYSNPGPPAPGEAGSPQDLGRAVLAARRAVIMMPHAPLVPGAVYDVSITADGSAYAWSFSTHPAARKVEPSIRRRVR